ncbi:MAG: hypothetical protein R3C19_04575 [Planctomycetaceae bacterium]
MTETASQLLAVFDSLSPQEQHELMTELLRRSGELSGQRLTDEQLVGIATETFLALDAEEFDDAATQAK